MCYSDENAHCGGGMERMKWGEDGEEMLLENSDS
jgi:hypothetical protein